MIRRLLGRGDLGGRGERVAARRLRRLGYRVLERNVRLPAGEIDLVCRAPGREGVVVVVEVKARRVGDGDHPPPEASITARKRAKLLSLAAALGRRPRYAGSPMRIDVVAVDFPARGRPAVRHYERAVTR